MRMKRITLLTLTMLLSVVAFAQSSQHLTVKQQALQAQRMGLLTEWNIGSYQFVKPNVPEVMQRQNANRPKLPVSKKGPAKVGKKKSAFSSSMPGKAKASRTAGTYFTYGFSQSANGWTDIDADGDGYSWTLNNQAGYNGKAGVMTSASYASTALYPDNYLVSPKMKLDGRITFYACAQDAAWAAEHFGVAVSTAGNTSASDFAMVKEWTMTAAPSLAPASFVGSDDPTAFRSPRRTQGNWYEYSIDLSSYAGAEGYVAIRHFDCTDMFRLNVDNIILETSELLDPYDPSLEVEPEMVELPTGAEVTPYYTIDGLLAVYTSSGWADYTSKVKSIKVAFVGSDVYFQGLAYWEPDAWVKGTISGNTITVPSGQYVGDGAYLNGMDNTGAFLDSYTFTYDSSAGTISCNDYIAESQYATSNSLYSYWAEPVFSLTSPTSSTVTPPAGLVTEDWTIARYFYNGEEETPEEMILQVGFDGNDVYVYGFSEYTDYLDDGGWIKGTLSGDGKSITFASGQYYGNYDGEYDFYFGVYDFITQGLASSITVDYDAEAGTMTWPYDAMVLEAGVANSLEDLYGYFTEIVACVRGTAPDPVEAPASLETTQWYFSALSYGTDEETGETVLENYGVYVNVGIDGNDVWVQGISEDVPECWIKGTLDSATNKVTFATGQHIGTYASWFWEFEYFLMGYGDFGPEDIVMAYDPAAKTMTMESPTYMLINAAWLIVDPNLIFVGAKLQEVVEMEATPAQPQITGGKLTDTNYPYIDIDIPIVDEEGNPMLSEKLTYQFYYDIDHVVSPLTLTTDVYTELTTDMTEIPYSFTDNWDVYNWRLYLYNFEEWNKIGIQSIYRGAGKEHKSEIFWYTLKDYPTPVDITVNPAAGSDIAQAVKDAIDAQAAELAANNQKAGNIKINLEKGDYTIGSSIEGIKGVSITGQGEETVIDAASLADPFIKMSAPAKLDANEAGGIPAGSILFQNLQIKNLAAQLVYANKQKYLFDQVKVSNCIVGIAGASNKTIFDFNGGGNTIDLTVVNSTLWADAATSWQNGGFYSSQSGQDVVSLGGTDQKTSIQNSTFYNISKGKTTSTRRKNSQSWMTYEVTKSIIVNSGKSGQFLKGLNAGQAGANSTWIVDSNSFIFDGADVEETCGGEVENTITGDPYFQDPENGDYTLGEEEYSDQLKYRIGDPRWLTPFQPDGITKPIELTIDEGADLAVVLKEYYEESLAPAYINLYLKSGANYTISEPLEINTNINIIAEGGEDPALIDATELGANPFVQMSSTLLPGIQPNESGFYFLPGNVVFRNIAISGLKGQLFYANKQKYIIDYLIVDNCIVHMEGANKKTIFDFNGGGYVNNLLVDKSTLSADAYTQWQNGGLYSTQSGTKASDAGILEKQHISITNSTLYNIAKEKTTCTLRENSKSYMTFDLQNNIIANSGKKGQFVKGLNAGSDSNVPTWNVSGNAFQWETTNVDELDNILYEDISEMEASGASKITISASVEGPVYFLDDEEFGNMSLGTCNQKIAKIGDPRWLFATMFVDQLLLDQAQGDLSYVINMGIKEGYNIFVLPEPADDDPYLYLKTLSPIKADKSLVIKSNPKVRINAGENAEPFIVLSDTPAEGYMNSSDYYGIEKIQLKGLWVICMRNSIIWDNNVKYCVKDLTIDNCVLSMTPIPGDIDGMPESMRTKDCKNEALIAFQAGGVKDFTIKNSTVCDNKDKAVAKYFIRYNNSARLDRYGFDKDNDFQSMTYTNNTFFGMLKADGQWGNYNGIQGQAYSKFDIQNNIWFNCGKDIIRRLAGGRFGDNAPRTFFHNTYYNDGVDLSGDEASYDNSGTALTGMPKFKFDVTSIYTPDYFHYDDYTLCTSTEQFYYSTGDPRWFINGGYNDGSTWEDNNGNGNGGNGGEFTDIEAIKTAIENGEAYDLQGRRVENLSKKGMYIVNGKKIVVK